ncbi:MAG TPA: tetratricopeptide repeat protein, partial [Acidobacteriota bacterium]
MFKAETIPKLPRLELQNFAPPIRRQLQEAFDDARSHPSDGAAAGRLGMLFQAYSQFEAAAVCYQRARVLQPEEWKWIYYHGVAQALLGRHEQAAAALAEVVRRKPDYLAAHLKLGESLFSSGKIIESQRIYETVIKAHPDSAAAQYGLGRASAARREFVIAVEHLTKACDLFASFGAAHYALGLAYRDLGDAGKAQEQLALYQKNKLVWPPAVDPLLDAVDDLNAGAQYHLKKGIALQSAGQTQAAVAEHERALQIDPNFAQAHVNLITLYGRLGQPVSAEKHYRAAVAINANLAEAHYNFG